jgi:hypothetical protein
MVLRVKIPRYPVTVIGKNPSHNGHWAYPGRPMEEQPISQETLVRDGFV